MSTRQDAVIRLAIWCALFFLPGASAGAQLPPREFEKAVGAFQREDFPQAERLLRQSLQHSPNSAFGLNLLGVTLDRQQKYTEAEEVFQRALKLGRSSALLNNLANHYLATTQRAKAREYFEETLRIESRHSNALYQLASMDVDDRRPQPALARIKLLPANEQGEPAIVLLKGRALLQLGEKAAARKALAPLEAAADQDAATAFSLGVMYFQEKLYEDAVRAFEAALRRSPGNFDILYNLGIAYDRQGQKQRAVDVLESAGRVNPQSVDALYHLATILEGLGRDEGATELLIRARGIAPARPELSLLLARLCLKQRFWPDAAEAYEDYLTLKAEDCDARRELAFLYGQLGNYEKGLVHINRYISIRPGDAQGLYLRGLLSWHLKRAEDATRDFRHALQLDPRLAEAWARLGDIAHEQNRLDEAERCFREALKIQPAEANALYGLGQTLNAQGRFREALPFLQQAVEIRPEEPAPHYQLSLSYRRLGQENPAREEIAKFQQIRTKSQEQKYFRTGLINYLQEGLHLSEKERQVREIQYLERASAIKPSDDSLKARLLDSYLALDMQAEAEKVIREWVAKGPNGGVHLRIGEILSAHGTYEAAIPHFRRAAQDGQVRPDALLALATAQFRAGQWQAALETLDSIAPPAASGARCLLLRAGILEKLGRYEEALAAYERAVRASPQQEGPYFELGMFLVRHRAYDAAAENFRAARKILPASLNLGLANAIALNLANRREDAAAELSEIQRQWPEKDLPYVLAGITAYALNRFDDSRQEFEKALALGSTNPLVPFYLASLETRSATTNLDDALKWAQMAVDGDPTASQAQYLLGSLLKRAKRNDEARQHLEKAVSLQPSLSEAHFLLAQIYADAGDAGRAEMERRESERWHREVSQVSVEKDTIQKLLVDVSPPAR